MTNSSISDLSSCATTPVAFCSNTRGFAQKILSVFALFKSGESMLNQRTLVVMEKCVTSLWKNTCSTPCLSSKLSSQRRPALLAKTNVADEFTETQLELFVLLCRLGCVDWQPCEGTLLLHHVKHVFPHRFFPSEHK